MHEFEIQRLTKVDFAPFSNNALQYQLILVDTADSSTTESYATADSTIPKS